MTDEKDPKDDDDDDMDEIAPGIVKTVHWLSSKGYDVFDSGDGCGEECGGCGAVHDDGVGFVSIFVDPNRIAYEANKLLALLRTKTTVPEYNKERPVNSIDVEVTYEPINDFAVIAVSHITDVKLFGEDPKVKALAAN